MIVSIFKWVENTRYAVLIRESTWGFAIFGVIHLIGLALLLGCVTMMSLRLCGLVMVDRPVSEISRALRRWTLAGLIVMLVSGLTLWASEAVRMYGNEWFWLKMTLLATAILFHFTLYRRTVGKDNATLAVRGLTGALALLLWFSIGFSGRAIGFLSGIFSNSP